MKNINSYIVGITLCILGLFPPLYLAIRPPHELWLWMVVLCGFAGFYTLFMKVDPVVKIVAVGGFVSCFYSNVIFISFTAYTHLIIACYFYILCRTIKDHAIVFKLLQCLLVINVFFFLMQFMGHDVLLNFKSQTCFGVVGQYMQSASFSVVLAATLLPYQKMNIFFPLFTSWFCNSVGAFLCFVIGTTEYFFRSDNKKLIYKAMASLLVIFFAWLWFSGKFTENMNMNTGRMGAWVRTLKMIVFDRVDGSINWGHILIGWGLGTYKGVFASLGNMGGLPWKTAHNCWLQIFFETGLVGLMTALTYSGYLVVNLFHLYRRKILKDQARACLAGFMMIAVNMMFHFPTRMIQTVLMIIFFISYCQGVINNGSRQSNNI